MMHNGKPADTFETFVRYTFCVSVAGLPALSIPGGVDNQGLPVGLQLIGPPWSEGRLTAIGYAFRSSRRTDRRWCLVRRCRLSHVNGGGLEERVLAHHGDVDRSAP